MNIYTSGQKCLLPRPEVRAAINVFIPRARRDTGKFGTFGITARDIGRRRTNERLQDADILEGTENRRRERKFSWCCFDRSVEATEKTLRGSAKFLALVLIVELAEDSVMLSLIFCQC